MILTHTDLISAGMPFWDVAKFHLRWPSGCELTPENYETAQAIGLSPDALFAAVCKSSEALREWYKIESTYDEENAIRKEADAKIKALREAAAKATLARKCRLLIEAMSHPDDVKPIGG